MMSPKHCATCACAEVALPERMRVRMQILEVLAYGPMRSGDLAVKMDRDATMISRYLRRMLAEKLVECSPDATDARARVYSVAA